MKVQILQLEPQDDLASVSDRLAWAQASRVVLVWPDRARVLRRRLDLVLLRRVAAARGIQIGIVSHDPVVHEQAAALGIPMFRSSTRLPEEGWGPPPSAPSPVPPRPWPRTAPTAPPPAVDRPLPRWLRIALPTIVGLVLLAALAILLPRATVTLSPARTVQRHDLTLTLDPRLEAVSAEGGLPAHQLTQTVSGSIRVTTSGTTQVPGQAASGQVVFTNQTDEPLLIPAGTGVLPSGRPDLRFETSAEASLGGERGATVEVDVVASRPGSAANLPSGSLNAIDGPLGLKASVAQPEAASGGSEAERPAVASADQATALRLLTEELLSQAAADMESELASDDVLAAGSIRVVNTKSSTFDRQIGEAGDSVGLELSLEVAALAYRHADLEMAVDQMLLLRREPGQEPVPESRLLTLTESPSARPEALRVRVEEQTYAPVDIDRVRQEVRGHRPTAALAQLSTMTAMAAPPVVDLRPGWWPILPWLDLRIDVRYAWERP